MRAFRSFNQRLLYNPCHMREEEEEEEEEVVSGHKWT
jgi:hypothetical protein